MAIERRVRRSGKDSNGTITALCNPGEWWSPRRKTDAISDLDSGDVKYYVEEQTPRSYVEVYRVGGEKHLRTTADTTSKNNLGNLPDC